MKVPTIRCVFYDKEDCFLGYGFIESHRISNEIFMKKPSRRDELLKESLYSTDKNSAKFKVFGKGPFGELFYQEME